MFGYMRLYIYYYYIHTYIHAYIDIYITYVFLEMFVVYSDGVLHRALLYADSAGIIHTHVHIYIHIHTHTHCIHAYVHTHIYGWIYSCSNPEAEPSAPDIHGPSAASSKRLLETSS